MKTNNSVVANALNAVRNGSVKLYAKSGGTATVYEGDKVEYDGRVYTAKALGSPSMDSATLVDDAGNKLVVKMKDYKLKALNAVARNANGLDGLIADLDSGKYDSVNWMPKVIGPGTLYPDGMKFPTGLGYDDEEKVRAAWKSGKYASVVLYKGGSKRGEIPVNSSTSVVTEKAVNASDAATRKFKPNDLVEWNDYKGRHNSAYYFRDNGPDRVTVSIYRDGQGGFLEVPRAWITNSRARNAAGYIDADKTTIRKGDAVVFKAGYKLHKDDDEWLERNGDTVLEVRGDEVKIGPSANDWAKTSDLMVWHNARACNAEFKVGDKVVVKGGRPGSVWTIVRAYDSQPDSWWITDGIIDRTMSERFLTLANAARPRNVVVANALKARNEYQYHTFLVPVLRKGKEDYVTIQRVADEETAKKLVDAPSYRIIGVTVDESRPVKAVNANIPPELRRAYDEWQKAKAKFMKWWNPNRRLSERPPKGADYSKYGVAFSDLFFREYGRRPPNGYGNMTLEQMVASNAAALNAKFKVYLDNGKDTEIVASSESDASDKVLKKFKFWGDKAPRVSRVVKMRPIKKGRFAGKFKDLEYYVDYTDDKSFASKYGKDGTNVTEIHINTPYLKDEDGRERRHILYTWSRGSEWYDDKFKHPDLKDAVWQARDAVRAILAGPNVVKQGDETYAWNSGGAAAVVANAIARNAIGQDKRDEASVETWTSLFENNFLKFQLPKMTDKERARKNGEKLIKYVEDALGSEGGRAQLKKMGWTVQKMRDALEKGLAAKASNAIAKNWNYKNQYQFFCVDPAMKAPCILSGWDYREDAKDDAAELKELHIPFKIVSRRYLEQQGIDPNAEASWKKNRGAARNADNPHDIDAHGKKLVKGDWVRFLRDLPDVKKGECALVKYALPGGLIFSTLAGAREVSWDASVVEKMPPIPRSLSEVEAWKKGPRA